MEEKTKVRYFSSAWGDIRHSPGWFGKFLLLSLINLIPIFGAIVTYGYLYGWAREMAWGIHGPMPARIFANDDGKFWWRGWLAFVLMTVFALPSLLLFWIGGTIDPYEYTMTFFGVQTTANGGLVMLKGFLTGLAWVLELGLMVFAWVGCMRIAIYNRLSAGFQFKRMWKMLRHDAGGLGRIFGMDLLCSLIFAAVLGLIALVLFTGLLFAVLSSLSNGEYLMRLIPQMTSAEQLEVFLTVLFRAGVAAPVVILLVAYLASLGITFIQMLVTRALGYWTRQFNVPLWAAQNDPMPFELRDRPRPDSGAAPVPPAVPMPAPPASPDQGFKSTAPGTVGAGAIPVPDAATSPGPDAVAPPSDLSGKGPASAEEFEAGAVEVTYDGPAVVGASFVFSPEEIESMRQDAAKTGGDAAAEVQPER